MKAPKRFPAAGGRRRPAHGSGRPLLVPVPFPPDPVSPAPHGTPGLTASKYLCFRLFSCSRVVEVCIFAGLAAMLSWENAVNASHWYCQPSRRCLSESISCLHFPFTALRVLCLKPAVMLTISVIYQHYPSAICCCDWHRFYGAPLFSLATVHTLCHVFRSWLISPYGFHMGTCCSC